VLEEKRHNQTLRFIFVFDKDNIPLKKRGERRLLEIVKKQNQ